MHAHSGGNLHLGRFPRKKLHSPVLLFVWPPALAVAQVVIILLATLQFCRFAH